MSKLKLSSYILLLSANVFSLAISLYYYIVSFSFYSDEYGTDISFNSDYVILLLVLSLSLGYLIYLLINDLKNNKIKFNYIIPSTQMGILSFYSLGVFFKQMNKNKPFMDYQIYLFFGIVTLILMAYFIVRYFLKSQNEN